MLERRRTVSAPHTKTAEATDSYALVLGLVPNQALFSSEAKAMCLPAASAGRRRCVHRRASGERSERTDVAGEGIAKVAAGKSACFGASRRTGRSRAVRLWHKHTRHRSHRDEERRCPHPLGQRLLGMWWCRMARCHTLRRRLVRRRKKCSRRATSTRSQQRGRCRRCRHSERQRPRSSKAHTPPRRLAGTDSVRILRPRRRRSMTRWESGLHHRPCRRGMVRRGRQRRHRRSGRCSSHTRRQTPLRGGSSRPSSCTDAACHRRQRCCLHTL